MARLIGTYNDRLFRGGIRRYYHTARFKWLRRVIIENKISCSAVLEIGCGDGKTLEWLPVRPNLYYGLDANHENLLDLAKEKYKNLSNCYFIETERPPQDIDGVKFDCVICMEVFEHISDEILEEYLEFIKRNLNGMLIVTVPIELGPVFLFKHLVKRFKYRDDTETFLYTPQEVISATFLQMQWVKRNMGGHKGFDYRLLINKLRNLFQVRRLYGIPFNFRPLFLNATVGVICQNGTG